MRRFERQRLERRRRVLATVGISFAIGALFDAALTWRLRELEPSSELADISGTVVEPENRSAEVDASLGTTPPVATAGATLDSAVDVLRARTLEIPVDGIQPNDLRDTFNERRALGRTHEAIDIMAPTGTPVRAVEDGTIAKLFNSRGGGGLTIYQFDPGEMFSYYYAHLDRYAPGLRDGQRVRRGEVIGYVGSTGNASRNAPHLHFAINRLTPEKRWWKGEPINPYDVLR
jgi:murein DD-endopeptidase MepM/ murein hydrolase activator NlpD